jgi:hypothetical protein
MNDCDTKRKSGAATLVRMGAKTGMAYEGTRYKVPKRNLIQTTLSAPSRWLKRLLSLITFFAAAKKVIPPPGRRLLQRKAQIPQAAINLKQPEKPVKPAAQQ